MFFEIYHNVSDWNVPNSNTGPNLSTTGSDIINYVYPTRCWFIFNCVWVMKFYLRWPICFQNGTFPHGGSKARHSPTLAISLWFSRRAGGITRDSTKLNGLVNRRRNNTSKLSVGNKASFQKETTNPNAAKARQVSDLKMRSAPWNTQSTERTPVAKKSSRLHHNCF